MNVERFRELNDNGFCCFKEMSQGAKTTFEAHRVDYVCLHCFISGKRQ